MLGILYFITPFVFLLLLVIFALCIREDIPAWMTVNIGRLNADDIRAMDSVRRAYLKKQVMLHLGLSVLITAVMAVIFFIIDFSSTAGVVISIVLCNAAGTAAGLFVALPVTKKANRMKDEMNGC